MTPLTGPLHAAAVVLLLAGLAKALRPAAAGIALRTVGLTGGRALVRALATVEIAVGAAVLSGTRPSLAAGALAALHVGFVGVAAGLRRRSADCGCFGEAAPVTGTHLVVNLLVAAAAGVAAVTGDLPSAGAAIGGTPGAGVPYALLVGVLAAGELLCLTALADLQAAAASRRGRAGATA
jgi:hypothetical protein